MRIRTATWDELNPEPPKRDTWCWCARPGGCDNKLPPGPAGRQCELCEAENHPKYDPEVISRANQP